MAVQLSPRVVLRVAVVLAFLGILLAGSLAPSLFRNDPAPVDGSTSTSVASSPATTLVPVDVRPEPPTTETASTVVHVGTMLDGGVHVLRPNPPEVVFVGGTPLEIRRIDALEAAEDCEGLRATLDRWLLGAAPLEEAELDRPPGAALEMAQTSSVFARSAFDAMARLDCG